MYDVLATLRRGGEPYELTAGELVRQTMVTTGRSRPSTGSNNAGSSSERGPTTVARSSCVSPSAASTSSRTWSTAIWRRSRRSWRRCLLANGSSCPTCCERRCSPSVIAGRATLSAPYRGSARTVPTESGAGSGDSPSRPPADSARRRSRGPRPRSIAAPPLRFGSSGSRQRRPPPPRPGPPAAAGGEVGMRPVDVSVGLFLERSCRCPPGSRAQWRLARRRPVLGRDVLHRVEQSSPTASNCATWASSCKPTCSSPIARLRHACSTCPPTGRRPRRDDRVDDDAEVPTGPAGRAKHDAALRTGRQQAPDPLLLHRCRIRVLVVGRGPGVVVGLHGGRRSSIHARRSTPPPLVPRPAGQHRRTSLASPGFRP